MKRPPRRLAVLLLAAAMPAFAQVGEVTRQFLPQFDADKNGRLDTAERQAAYDFTLANPIGRGGRGRAGQIAPTPGPSLMPAEVKHFPNAPLYDPKTLRTLFIQFEDADWEKKLAAFNNTDVEVPAIVTVDGKTYPEVGIHFRGNSSFSTVTEGYKRSLNLSFDWVHDNQALMGYNTLNLLNAHIDPTFLRTVLYMQIAREYLPAPKANYVRVVINGESWGIYISAQQFNKSFTRDFFNSTAGARWHIGAGTGGFTYRGDSPESYKTTYEIKSKDNPADWAALATLMKTLNQTPPAQLVAALTPMFDLDGALRFLALENALLSGDGYWSRASDFNLYRDEKGIFHVVPHDANETLRAAPAGRGGAAIGMALDPLQVADDPTKPLVSKLLAVPELRTKYLGYVREIATKWLDWNRLGPIAAEYQALIADDVARDTRKLYPTANFRLGLTQHVSTPGFGSGATGLKPFADERRAYLLNATEP